MPLASGQIVLANPSDQAQTVRITVEGIGTSTQVLAPAMLQQTYITYLVPTSF